MEEVKMNVFVPLDIEGSIKKSDDTSGDWYVRGYATTPDLDMQGDIISPEGIDISYFKQTGYINSEHNQGPHFQVGVPTDNCFVDANKGLFIEAKLFKENEYAKGFWGLASNILKSGINRKLGFSIEGKIRKRDTNDNRVIKELLITNVALTKNPANPYATWETFMKSIHTGHDINPETQAGGEALRHEQLATAITHLAWAYKNKDTDTVKDLWDNTLKHLDTIDRLDENSAIIVLQASRGLSRKDAVDFINRKE